MSDTALPPVQRGGPQHRLGQWKATAAQVAVERRDHEQGLTDPGVILNNIADLDDHESTDEPSSSDVPPTSGPTRSEQPATGTPPAPPAIASFPELRLYDRPDEIPGNVMALARPLPPSPTRPSLPASVAPWALLATDVAAGGATLPIHYRLLAQRLLQWSKTRRDEPSITWRAPGDTRPVRPGDALTVSELVRGFQQAERALIDTIRGFNTLVDYVPALAGQHPDLVTDGECTPHDATTQALANAFPRTVLGLEVSSHAEAYERYAAAVEARGLLIDRARANLLGIRAYQAGHAHKNPDASQGAVSYDDTMVLLSHDDEGPIVYEFRITTKPGLSSITTEKDGEEKTVNGWTLVANQQFAYAIDNEGATVDADRVQLSRKMRPLHSPLTGTQDVPHTMDPFRSPNPNSLRPRGYVPRWSSPGAALNRALAGGSQSPNARPLYGSCSRWYVAGSPSGPYSFNSTHFYMHTGGKSEIVDNWSMGCQVLHGPWYGFALALVRAAGERYKASQPAPPSIHLRDGLPHARATSEIIYILLDARELVSPSSSAGGV